MYAPPSCGVVGHRTLVVLTPCPIDGDSRRRFPPNQRNVRFFQQPRHPSVRAVQVNNVSDAVLQQGITVDGRHRHNCTDRLLRNRNATAGRESVAQGRPRMPAAGARRRRTAVNDGKGAFRVGDLSAPGPTQPARGAFRVGTSSPSEDCLTGLEGQPRSDSDDYSWRFAAGDGSTASHAS